MLEHRPASPTDNAFCIGCGYPLRRLESDRCPECGRAFEPADARTMSAGRPLRRWQRCLLEPIGWPTIALALLGTAGLLYLGGWPRLSPEPWPVLRDEFRWPSRDLRPFTAPDIVFHTAIAFWVAFWALVLLRRLALLLVPCGGASRQRVGSKHSPPEACRGFSRDRERIFAHFRLAAPDRPTVDREGPSFFHVGLPHQVACDLTHGASRRFVYRRSGRPCCSGTRSRIWPRRRPACGIWACSFNTMERTLSRV